MSRNNAAIQTVQKQMHTCPNTTHTQLVITDCYRIKMNSSIFDSPTSLLFATTFLVAFLVYRRRRTDDRKYPPTLSWLPVVGSLPFMGKAEDLPKLFLNNTAQLGNIFGFYAGSKCVVCIDYNYVQLCLLLVLSLVIIILQNYICLVNFLYKIPPNFFMRRLKGS